MMGKRGPATMPTQLRLLKGDHHKSRFNPNEPVARDTLPTPPEDMAVDVREIWDYTLDELVAMKTAAAADRDSLICYCEAVVAHRKASKILAKSPVLVKGALGTLVRNPALQVQRDAAHAIRAFAQEFGLTPSARTRIQVDKQGNGEQANPFAAVG
jgi:P27 family predicted phage terminase small subunit